MTNTNLLNYAIARSGIGRQGLAEKIGLSLNSVQKKINNVIEFRQSEIQNVCEALELTNAEKESIFFAPSVDLK